MDHSIAERAVAAGPVVGGSVHLANEEDDVHGVANSMGDSVVPQSDDSAVADE